MPITNPFPVGFINGPRPRPKNCHDSGSTMYCGNTRPCSPTTSSMAVIDKVQTECDQSECQPAGCLVHERERFLRSGTCRPASPRRTTTSLSAANCWAARTAAECADQEPSHDGDHHPVHACDRRNPYLTKTQSSQRQPNIAIQSIRSRLN